MLGLKVHLNAMVIKVRVTTINVLNLISNDVMVTTEL